MTEAGPSSNDSRATRLRELAALFLKLGTTAFGGPAAHVALMQNEVVKRRGWLTDTEFLDMWAATNFIPGPNSTEMAIHIGYRRAGWAGLFVAGCCFIVPAAILCMIIAAFYKAYGRTPVSVSLLWGVKPVVIGVVGQALFRLGKTAVKSWLLAGVGILAVAALFLGIDELIVLAAGGVIAGLAKAARGQRRGTSLPMLAFPLAQSLPVAQTAATATAAAATTVSAALLPLFLVFLKIGSVLFGSGYVLLAFLRADFVVKRHWLTESQLLDAVAVGQVTPGPVFTTATFIGYVLGDFWGAVLATLGIFLPAFFFVWISAPLLPRLRKSPVAGAFLDGLNVASLALMAVVLFRLAVDALGETGTAAWSPDWPAIALAVAALVALLWKNVNSVWLILAGAAIGIARAEIFHL